MENEQKQNSIFASLKIEKKVNAKKELILDIEEETPQLMYQRVVDNTIASEFTSPLMQGHCLKKILDNTFVPGTTAELFAYSQTGKGKKGKSILWFTLRSSNNVHVEGVLKVTCMFFAKTNNDDGLPNTIECSLATPNHEIGQSFLAEVVKHQLKEKKSDLSIGLLQSRCQHLDVVEISLKEVELDVDVNYGSGFRAQHEKLVKSLQTDDTGLYILHGPPGTGKTSYIKYLAQKINRMFIFLPAGQLNLLNDPQILSVLLHYPNSVLIIEDAEHAVQNREDNTYGASIVSMLLNMTDGFLGSMLRTSIIVTFNTKWDNIDKALERKGRLKFKHHFDLLSPEDSQRVLEKLGKKGIEITEPTSLTDLYNIDADSYTQNKKTSSMGFKPI